MPTVTYVAAAHLECGRLDRRDWLAHHRQRQRELDARAAGLAARLGVGGDDGGLEGRRAAEVVTFVCGGYTCGYACGGGYTHLERGGQLGGYM